MVTTILNSGECNEKVQNGNNLPGHGWNWRGTLSMMIHNSLSIASCFV
jgi:hypothetical protein